MIAGFQEAPFWAQIVMVLAAVTALWMVLSRPLSHRKHRRHLDRVAGELGQGPPTNREWPYVVPLTVGERTFQIRYDYRTSGAHSSYRGPMGHLLITATQLGGNRWSMHQVDIRPVVKWLSQLIGRRKIPGAEGFDSRFIIKQDGLPPRERWLDNAMREAIAQFFERVPKRGEIWIRQGDLQFIMSEPWTDLDGQAIRRVMEQQSVLADALDRTAGYVR